MISTDTLNRIVSLRLIIGYLGEKEQFNWWNCSFLSKSSDSFLSPVFVRTTFLAKYNGVKEAVSKVHDEHVGLGDIYHFFRLPENIEQKLHQFINNNKLAETIYESIIDKDKAFQKLKQNDPVSDTMSEGPIAICNVEEIVKTDIIDNIAGMYYIAFKTNKKVYPYFKK